MNIRIAIPSKGRISEPSLRLLEKAGIGLIDNSNRKLFSQTFDPEINIMFTRASDIPEYVADGAADIGITGLDLVKEKDSDVEILEDLKFGQTRLVIAVPEDSNIKSVDDLEDGCTIATEFPNITKQYLDNLNIQSNILELSGSTELAPLIGVADAISDLTSSGTTLKMNHLREIKTILSSSINLIANKDSLESKFEKIEAVRNGVLGVLNADGKKLLMANIKKDLLDDVINILPGMSGPTISEIYKKEDLVAVHAVLSEKEVFNTINKLTNIGARDILVVPIERILQNK